VRSLAQIDADLEAARAQVKALCDERRESLRHQVCDLRERFLAGHSVAQIAKDTGRTPVAIRASLWRVGLTVPARAQLRSVGRQGEHQESARP